MIISLYNQSRLKLIVAKLHEEGQIKVKQKDKKVYMNETVEY